jgi:hypothetical protein
VSTVNIILKTLRFPCVASKADNHTLIRSNLSVVKCQKRKNRPNFSKKTASDTPHILLKLRLRCGPGKKVVHEVDKELGIGSLQERFERLHFHHIFPTSRIYEKESEAIGTAPIENFLTELMKFAPQGLGGRAVGRTRVER